MRIYKLLPIYVVILIVGCSQPRKLNKEEYLNNGLQICDHAIALIKTHPESKELRKTVKANYKLFKKTKSAARKKLREKYSEEISECEATINAFLNKKQIERKKKAAKKREDLLKLTELNNEKIVERALKLGHKAVHFTGISQFISSAINNPDRIKENWNHVFTLKNHDSMFVVTQIVNDVVVYQVDTSKAPYDLVNVIYPYGERLSDVVIIQPKHKDSQYFIGQKLGVNEKEKYYVFVGTKEYETRIGGMNTAFVFNRVFK